MSKRALVVVAGVLLVGCGQKAQDARNAMAALQQVATGAAGLEANQAEFAKFYKERIEKGDTVAVAYTELQKRLPSAPDGYTAAEEPGGSSQSMGGFSMSQAEQKFTMPAGADGNAPTIEVTLVDFGGTQAAYGMMALPMMMNVSSEDAHHRMSTIKVDIPYSWASEEYNKDSKEAKVAIVTRYRYLVTVEARNQAEDQSEMVKRLATDLARKFEGK